ncbi:MAG: tripartite tricarboxylate transporter substrate binding protein [Betaproteobacteria bacterium]|nr:tripartite tricarboxylate transporter substrate binding protein [Betaproteobacteria bacterium]
MAVKFVRFAAQVSVTLAASALGFGAAAAQNFPTRPIQFIVPYGPGSGNDLIARVIAQKIGDSMGNPLVVENRSGAAGAIGTELAARATPDGHTILIASTSQTINPYVTKVNYNLQRDFAAIIRPATLPYVLAVPVTSSAKSIKELVALCKANPGKFSYAGTFGSASHFMGEMLKSAGKIDISLVSYKSTSDAVPDVISNRVGIWFTTTATGIPLAKSGKIRIIGVSGKERLPIIADTPTMVEAGFPTLDVPVNFYVLTAAASPKTAVEKLNQAFVKALSSKEVKDKLAAQGVEASVTTPEEASKILRNEIASWGRVVKESGVKMQ